MAKLIDKKKKIWNETMKAEVQDAAMKVLDKYGFAGFTMDRVAAEAGVAKGTLYNYFEDKEQLMISILDSSFIPLVERMASIADSDLPPIEKLQNLIEEGFKRFDSERNNIVIMITAGVTPHSKSKKVASHIKYFRTKNAAFYKKAITEGIRKGVFRKVDADKTAAMISSFHIGMLFDHIDNTSKNSSLSDKFATSFTDIVLTGITK